MIIVIIKIQSSFIHKVDLLSKIIFKASANVKIYFYKFLRCHEFCLSAIGTDNVIFLICDETTTDEWWFAAATNETIIMPVTILEGDEASATDACKNIKFEWNLFNFNFHEDLPVIGLVHAVQRFANNSPKQSAQYGFSSRLVKRWPAKGASQCVQTKHSRCHGSFL